MPPNNGKRRPGGSGAAVALLTGERSQRSSANHPRLADRKTQQLSGIDGVDLDHAYGRALESDDELDPRRDRRPSGEPPRRIELRPYQVEVIDRLRAATREQRRILLEAPTGSGKTIIAAAIVQFAIEKNRRVLFLAHRRELIHQAADKLLASGIESGVILAGHPLNLELPAQVASIATLWSRAFRGSAMEAPPADLIVVDEAHHARARTYQKIIERYPEAIVLGLTATPCRGDGRGLGASFDMLVECPGVQELIDLGFLVATKVYAPSTPDLCGVRVERGDYVERQLAERVDTPKLVGDVVEHWHRLADGRRTVVFATGVGHSIHIRDEFRRSGIAAEHIDGTTPVEERDAILARLSRGEIDVITNCMVLTEGWDQPDVACIVLARPTKSMGLYRQMVGRVLRPAPGKEHALVLDHAGATLEHGFVEDAVIWTLDPDRRAANTAHAARGEHHRPGLAICPECSAVRISGKPCPACGWQPRPKPHAVDVADGELESLSRDGRMTASVHDKDKFLRQLLWIVKERGYKTGWAAHKFKTKFGHWPRRDYDPEPEPPDPAVRSWVRSRQIAYARALGR
jgi:DNA repair protein RadD